MNTRFPPAETFRFNPHELARYTTKPIGEDEEKLNTMRIVELIKTSWLAQCEVSSQHLIQGTILVRERLSSDDFAVVALKTASRKSGYGTRKTLIQCEGVDDVDYLGMLLTDECSYLCWHFANLLDLVREVDPTIIDAKWMIHVSNPVRIFVYDYNGSPSKDFKLKDHDVIILEFSDGRQLVWDPTEEQYGYSGTFIEKEQYLRTRVRKRQRESCEDIQTLEDGVMGRKSSADGLSEYERRLQYKLLDVAMEAVKVWASTLMKQANVKSLQGFFGRLTKDEYVRLQEELSESMRQQISAVFAAGMGA